MNNGEMMEGMWDGDSNSITTSSEIDWRESGEMVTSGVWYELTYEVSMVENNACVRWGADLFYARHSHPDPGR